MSINNNFNCAINNYGIFNSGHFINSGVINLNANQDKAQTQQEKTAQNVHPVAEITITHDSLNHTFKKTRTDENVAMTSCFMKNGQKSPRIWTKEETSKIKNALQLYGPLWPQVSRFVGTKTPDQCKTFTKKHFPEIVEPSKAIKWHFSNEMQINGKRIADSDQMLTESAQKKVKKLPENSDIKLSFDFYVFKQTTEAPINDKSKSVSQMNQQPQANSKMSVSHLCSNTTSTIPSMDEWFKSIN